MFSGGLMKKLRTQLFATTAMLALSSVAYAADMAVKMPVKAPPPAPAPVTNWTGFYVGAQIGGASFDPSCSTTGPSFATDFALPCNTHSGEFFNVLNSSSLSSAGVIGGGKIGYDYQWDRIVLGVVGEFDWTDLNGTSRVQSIDGGVGVATANERLDWLASVRGRVGWAFDNVLFYGTGGVAWTRIKASTSVSNPGAGANFATPEFSTTKTGAVAGGGIEYRVTPHVSVVGEVLWYGFGSNSVNVVCSDPPFCVGTAYTTEFSHQDVVAGTLGVNWRF
jgi:outer membrane immunogenic protein